VEASRSVEQMFKDHQDEITHLRRERHLRPDYALEVINTRSLLSGPALQARLLLNSPEMRMGDIPGSSATCPNAGRPDRGVAGARSSRRRRLHARAA
jgi:hypothetical protein